MENSDEANNSRNDNTDDDANVNINADDFQARIDAAVDKAMEKVMEKFKETSATRSKTHSKPHSSHKESFVHSSNAKSEPKKIVFDEKPRSTKGCTYKYFVSCKPKDFNGEKGDIDCMCWLDEMETMVDISGCAKEDTVTFVSQSFKGETLTWWKTMIQSTGKIPLYNLEWSKFVDIIKEVYCPQHEVEKDLLTDFNSMSRLVPYLITLEPKSIARFIGGLAPEIKGHVKASKPTTYRSVVDLSLSLTLDVMRSKSGKTDAKGKRKREDDNSQRSNKKKKRKKGHKTLECKNLKDAVFYGCNEKGHIKTNCPKNAKKHEEAKKGNARAYKMNARQAVNDDNVITGTFLINNVYARVLFDSGADKSFVDLKFSKLLNLPIGTLDIKYEVELADGT
ncbi:uncharacterized protein LOC110891130 [Helianthus annuus]|uniref:uncharacterized protein LOC110891130 n=1 Tax=Helianthus annuus TaxID=4232 RepID=UPI000B8F1E81|nr:uncharacterized protein LOC110891130 [Helianthus annuus]